jgi:Na+/proline symporter
MMSAKDERHSVFATLWFTIAHYCVRPWPWILVGLATVVLYPELGPEQKRLGYVYAMRDHLPSGLRGLLVASFFAAYMSTVSTHLNWGTSYVINDVYKRFLRPRARERELVLLSRVTTLLVMGLSLYATRHFDTISGAWTFVIEAGAGLGLVLILRFYWWRINAWSEIAAMAASLASYAAVRYGTDVRFPMSLYPIVALTTAAWLAVTFLTRPVHPSTLIAFYETVRPGGPGWRPIARVCPEVRPDAGLFRLALNWVAGVVLVYSMLFASGELLLGDPRKALILAALALGAGAFVWHDLARHS